MRKKPKKKKVAWVWRWFFYLSGLLVLLSAIGTASAWIVYKHYAEGLPTLSELTNYRPSLVTRVFARDYQMLGEFFIQKRQFVPMADVPKKLVSAFLAVEDSRFYDHPGIDVPGIIRAMIANIKAGQMVQGASTITQQVARTFLLTSIKTLGRKIKEMILSFRIEQQFTKDKILELYVNQIYLGAGAYGVGAAARIYFNKDVSELNLGQIALLAGLPKAPNNYSPWRYPERARRRQKLVLGRMQSEGLITEAERDAAAEAPFGLARPAEPLEQVAPHYLEHVRRTILSEWGGRQLYRGGLDVYTTLDPRLQRMAQKALRNGLVAYDRRHGYRGPIEHLTEMGSEAKTAWLAAHKKQAVTISGYLRGLVVAVPNHKPVRVLLVETAKEVDLPLQGIKWARKNSTDNQQLGPEIRSAKDVLHVGDVILLAPPTTTDGFYLLAQEPAVESALVCLDPHTGQILAMVGGYDFGRSEFNRVTQGRRQPGSAFKPFVYAAALDQSYSPASLVDDSPIAMQYRDAETGAVKVWNPENYEQKFYGPTTLRNALVHSRNLVTIRLMKNLGMNNSIPYLNRFGLQIPDSRRDLSLALGSLGFTPLQIATGYAVFANGGKLVEPVYIARVQDRFGRTIHRHRGGDCLLCHLEPEANPNSKGKSTPPLFGKRILAATTSYQVTSLLKGVITHGTGRKASKLGLPLAGKTGTTNDLRDAWFVGFSPSLVTAVWVGFDDSSMLGPQETGSAAALPIWMEFMGEALKGQPTADFPIPPGIHLEAIDAENGRAVTSQTKDTVMEAFKAGQSPNPPEESSSDAPTQSPGVDEGLY